MEKLMKKLLCLLILPLALFLACDTGSSDPGSNVDPGGNQIMVGAQVRDANGVLLGSLLETRNSAIKVLTPESYIVFMDWGGLMNRWTTYHYCNSERSNEYFFDRRLYATGVDMSGTLFMPSISAPDYVYGKIAFVFPYDESKIYTFKNLDTNNIVELDFDFDTSYASYDDFAVTSTGSLTNENGNFDADPSVVAAYVFKEITRTELGLPETIAEGPLSFSIE